MVLSSKKLKLKLRGAVVESISASEVPSKDTHLQPRTLKLRLNSATQKPRLSKRVVTRKKQPSLVVSKPEKKSKRAQKENEEVGLGEEEENKRKKSGKKRKRMEGGDGLTIERGDGGNGLAVDSDTGKGKKGKKKEMKKKNMKKGIQNGGPDVRFSRRKRQLACLAPSSAPSHEPQTQNPQQSELSTSQEPHTQELQQFKLSTTCKKTRGPTYLHDLYNHTGEKIHVPLNEHLQPIEGVGGQYGQFLGTMARNESYFQVDVKRWDQIPKAKKDIAWEFIKTKFDIPEETKRWSFLTMRERWRDWKYKLAQKYNPELPIEDQLNPPDPRVGAEQWANLLSYLQTDEARKKSETNKANRAKNRMGHACGTKSFARLRHEEEAKLGTSINRVALFRKTHSRKDGTPVDQASAEVMKKFDELSSQLPAESEASQSSNGCIAARDDFMVKAIGEEKRGRVRGLGMGPTPLGLWGRNPNKYTMNRELVQDNKRLQATIKGLDAKWEQKYNELQENIEAQVETKLQAQVQASVSAMLERYSILSVNVNAAPNVPSPIIQSSAGSHDATPHSHSAGPRISDPSTDVKLTFPGLGVVAHALLMSEDPSKIVGGRQLEPGWVEVIPKLVLQDTSLLRVQEGLKSLSEASLNGIAIHWLREYLEYE